MPFLTFGVADVAAAYTEVLAAGARVTWCYATDPGGNPTEFQSRS